MPSWSGLIVGRWSSSGRVDREGIESNTPKGGKRRAVVIQRPHGGPESRGNSVAAEESQNAMIAIGFLYTSRRVRAMRVQRHKNPMTACAF